VNDDFRFGGSRKMIKRIILSAMIIGSISACSEHVYLPNTVKLDVRTAQDEVRTLLMRAPLFTWSGEEAQVSDVRFRSDGMALLVDKGGAQTTHACYYAGMTVDNLTVSYLAVGREGFGGPQYSVGFCGAAWFNSQTEAQRLSDALFSLKNSRQ